MQPPLKLTDEERLCFMQALNAVAWCGGGPTSVWRGQLEWFGRLLKVPDTQYMFQAAPPGIAEKVNQIADRRARLYFLRIIHDIHRHNVFNPGAWMGRGWWCRELRATLRSAYRSGTHWLKVSFYSAGARGQSRRTGVQSEPALATGNISG